MKSDDDEDHCLDLLSLSYTHLPVHLKPCFLYMGILEEDERIDVSQIIKLFVAEGFLRPNKIQSLEETAHDYIKDFIDRNLILVSKWGWNGTAKVCYIHDLLRDICLRVAEKEEFLRFRSLHDGLRGIDVECASLIVFPRAISKYPREFDALPSSALVRSLINDGYPLPHKFRLLRVLTIVERVETIFQQVNSLRVLTTVERDPAETVFQQVNLRYLLYEPYEDSGALLPSSASRL